MVAVNWIIKSSERCEHHKGLVDGRLSQESDNTYRESRPASVYGGQTLHTGIGVLKGWPWLEKLWLLLARYVRTVMYLQGT